MNLRLTLGVDQFLLSSDLSVHYWPIVPNTFIRKSTLPILLGVLTSLYDELEIDLELWPVIRGQILVADPQSKKRVTEKRLIFTGQKISLLALHTASLELDHILPVKSRKIDLKGVGVAFWYLSITPQNSSRAVVKNLRILVCRSSLRLTITHLKVNLVTSHHQVVSLF